MANRTWHINFAIIIYGLTIGLLVFFDFFSYNWNRDKSWLFIGFLMTIFGAEFPDLDQIWRQFFDHRDWLLHSAIVPVLMLYFIIGASTDNIIMYPLMALFCIGTASHLFLDYFPTWSGDPDKQLELSDISYAAQWIYDGISGEELTQKLSGTYLIHFPGFMKKFGFKRQTFNKKMTRIYLFVNAIILIILAIILFVLFEHATA